MFQQWKRTMTVKYKSETKQKKKDDEDCGGVLGVCVCLCVIDHNEPALTLWFCSGQALNFSLE